MSYKLILLTIVLLLLHCCSSFVSAEDAGSETTFKAKLELEIETLSQQIETSPQVISHYSRRGDAYFFAGEFEKSVADYDKMVELDQMTDRSHWRRGIAYFYVGKYEQAAAQFNRYHSFDNVDRENGIWRYLSQYRSKGKAEARKELLKYDKDDREPFGDVYLLFAGKISGREIIEKIQTAELPDSEQEKRLFYATLYVGLNHSVEGQDKLAENYLKQAASNTWPKTAGYGPHYMWQVARLHLKRLQSQKKPKVDSISN